jgi:signal transduction histidine kinase
MNLLTACLIFVNVILLFLVFKFKNSPKSVNLPESDPIIEFKFSFIQEALLLIHSRADFIKVIWKNLLKLPAFISCSSITLAVSSKDQIYSKSFFTHPVSERYYSSIAELINPYNKKIENTFSGSDIKDTRPYNLQDYKLLTFNLEDGLELAILIGSTQKEFLDKLRLKVLEYLLIELIDYYKNINHLIFEELSLVNSFLENSDEGLIFLNKDYSIYKFNKKFLEIFSFSSDDINNSFDVFSYLVKELNIYTVFDEVLNTKKTIKLPPTLINELGKYLEVIIFPIKNKSTNLGIGLLVKDRTAKIHSERDRQSFQAMLVHELRSPLTVIKGTGEMLMNNFTLLSEHEKRSFTRQISASATSLLSLVNDLLDLAKLDSGKFSLHKSEVDLNSIIKDEIVFYKSLLNSKNITLKDSLDSSTPKVYVDPERIKQVFNNLISNAYKYSTVGSDVEIKTQFKNNFVEVSISDTGPGIADSDKLKLFKRFSQLETSNLSKSKGTGLGLSVTKGIIENHGGEIYVKDNLPQGSVFVFTLPLKERLINE